MALAVAALAAGCAPLPTPFAHEAEDLTAPRKKMIELPDSAGIYLNPEIAGASPELSRKIADAMIAALGEANVPASSAGRNRASYRLEGRLAAAPISGAGRVLILWTLTDAKDAVVGEHLQNEAVDAKEWLAGSRKSLGAIARRGAAAVAAFIQDKATEPARSALQAGVEVRAIEGAPGDGRTSLTRAIKHYLAQARVKVVDDGQGGASVLQGVVTVGPARGNNQPITIVWKVLRPDGTEVGRADQGNFVPAGSLDGAWSDTAYLIAEAATPGITDILGRMSVTVPGDAAKPPGLP